MKTLLSILFLSFASVLSAATLDTPSGRVVLTITGEGVTGNIAEGAAFDLAMLDALPQRDTATSTPWMDGTPTFSGPLGSALLDALGIEGGTLRVYALNDYFADVPVQDFRDFPVIFATRMNGETLSVRDKGPIFVIYPFDEHPELFNEVYFGRSVWQVSRIEVID